MKISLGDLFVHHDTEVYYVTDIQYSESLKISVVEKVIMILMNPKAPITITKRIMYPDVVEDIIKNKKPYSDMWKYYPVMT